MPTTTITATTTPAPTTTAAPTTTDPPIVILRVPALAKDASVTETSPGEAFSYTLVASCSGLQEGCVNAVLTDVIPAGLEVTDLPASTSEYTVSYDAGSRTMTVVFTIPLASPPNPPASVGIPAGAALNLELGVAVPAESQIVDGTVITNTASLVSDGAAPITASDDVVVDVPRVVRPVATKSWPDGSAVAGIEEPSTITLGVRNASSSSADVTELTVTDATPAVYERFDVTGIGPVTMPAGADRVVVQACTLALSACDDDDYVASAPQTGPSLTFPTGVAAASVTGLRFVFTDSAGAPLPFDPTGGSVDVDLVLRNTLRSTGAPYVPTTRDDVRNCATPSATDVVQGEVTGTDDCVVYSVQPAQATLSIDKAFFSDTNGNFVADGRAVVGEDDPVSALTSVTNTSPFPVATITISEPSATSPSEYSKVDITDIRLVFPTGATTADLVVDCGGALELTRTVTAPPTTVNQPTGCPGPAAESVTVTYRGVDADGAGTIAERAIARLGVRGTLNDTATAADANRGPGASGDGVLDCADGAATSSIDGVGAAAGTDCASLILWLPYSDLDGVKAAQLPTVLPGLPRLFTMNFTNTGTVAATNVVLADPLDPTAPGNPFSIVRLADLTLDPGYPGAVAEVYDPDVGGYVAYDAADAALLERALGFRVTVPSVTPGTAAATRYDLSFNVYLRDGVAPGTTFANCAAVGSDTQAPEPFCSQEITTIEPSSGASLQKSITPPTSVRPQAGLPGATVQVKHAVQSTGTQFLRRLVVVDNDPAFYDAVDIAGSTPIWVNFPPGADRVQVDVCTIGVCGEGDWVLGAVSASPTPPLPAGAPVASITGVRVTFTAVPVATPSFPDGDPFRIQPGTNFPTTGACTGASVCVAASIRTDLRSQPGVPVPDELVNTATGGFESRAQDGALAPIPPSQATHTLTTGTGRLQVSKIPDTAVAPGTGIPYVVRVRNAGTGPVPDPVIVEPIPAGLEFSPLDAAVPFEISSVLPVGAPEPPEVVFTPTTDPATGRVTELRWEFPGWDLVPGGSVSVGFRAVLAPGATAGTFVENRAGATGDRPDLTCDPTLVPRPGEAVDDPLYGAGRYCTSGAPVSVLAGNAFRAEKWVAGDPDLGFLDSVSGDIVALDDPRCPRLTVGGQLFTRFPCAARVLPGQGFDFYLRLTNSGTNPATEVRLVDVFPYPGDTGVLLTGSPRGTEWTPGLLSPVTLAGRGTLDVGYSSAGGGWCTTELNRPPTACGAAWSEGFSTAARAFRAALTFPPDALLQPGETTALRFRMVAPPSPAVVSTNDVAWNSFGHTEFFHQGTTVVQLPPTEPEKTGVALVFGGLSILKTVDDPTGGSDGLVFGGQYECTVTPEGGEPVVVAAGEVELGAGERADIDDVPAGARCAVWEPDAQGLVSNAPDRDRAIIVEVPISGGAEPLIAELINTATTTPPAPTPPPSSDPAVTTTDPASGGGPPGPTTVAPPSTTALTGELPSIGSDPAPLAAIAALLAGLGAIAVVAARRRRPMFHPSRRA